MATVKCVGALLARNEAGLDRYLERVLKNAFQFCDEVVVLDDHSTDGTAGVCRDAGCIVHERDEGTDGVGGWWGSRIGEAPARATLWNLAVTAADPSGWIWVFDADHELVGLRPTDFRRLLAATNVDAWACPLYDCWGDDEHHRVDGYWQAWRSPRVWLARAYPAAAWNDRAIHVGHLPERVWRVGLMPDGAAIRHLGYIVAKQRVDKQRKYLHLQH